MTADAVKVPRVDVTREEVDYGHSTAGKEILEALAALVPSVKNFRLPLAKEHVRLELEGVPTAVANALRRVLTDEMRGQCLYFERSAFDRGGTTDPFMVDDFVLTRVRMIPLRPQIPEAVIKNLRFALDVKNPTDTVMAVYSGDLLVTKGELTEPLFNPTHEIASLQPGKTLRINEIRIIEGLGVQHASFAVGVRAVARPLDLKRLPRKETHRPGGKATAQSGYVESSLVANPRRHEVSVWFPAVPAGKVSITLLVDACGVIMKRLRYIQKVLSDAKSSSAPPLRSANAYFVVSSDGDRAKGVLGVQNETHTIGNLLTRAIYELEPDISYAGYTCIPYERIMKLTVAHSVSDASDIRGIVDRAVRHAYGIFNKIAAAIKARLD